MWSVPTEGLQVVPLCDVCEYIPSFPLPPGPMPARKRATVPGSEFACLHCGQVWDEVDGEADAMRALPRSRFRSAFAQHLRLTAGEAQRLEDFEAELKLVGLIQADEIMVDVFCDGSQFRVEKRDRRDAAFRDSRRVQGGLLNGAGTELSPAASPAALGRGSRVKGLSGASLDAGETLVRQGVPSNHLCENTRDSGPREARTCIPMHK